LDLRLALILFGALGLVALVSADGRWPYCFRLAKPATTLALLTVTGFPAQGAQFELLVVVGLLLCAVGDTALLGQGRSFFLAGLFFFLLAHLAYTLAFLLGGGAGPVASSALAGFGVVVAATLWLVRRIWRGVEPALRGPVLAYAAAITVMVGAAYLVLAGPWPARVGIAVTGGAVLFYLSDALLAWSRFRQAFGHQQSLTLVFYWAGQFGIALGARWVAEGRT
jgi:uncharacterized membrane protein YhhN